MRHFLLDGFKLISENWPETRYALIVPFWGFGEFQDMFNFLDLFRLRRFFGLRLLFAFGSLSLFAGHVLVLGLDCNTGRTPEIGQKKRLDLVLKTIEHGLIMELAV